ncbi:MAG: gliding motility lipoprotein GldH [Prevotella sp.]|nr:gliding motility lipoprotein GldH [Prevotella sp.]
MRNKSFIIVLAMVALMISACHRGVIYSHYEHVDNDGWERNDTIHFYIPSVKKSGVYHKQLMLRTDNSLPFLGISVIVEQEVYPRGQRLRKNLDCPLVEKNGRVMGNGISCYQYTFDVDSVELFEGDSLHVFVIQNMKREPMPGITDVGILVSD